MAKDFKEGNDIEKIKKAFIKFKDVL